MAAPRSGAARGRPAARRAALAAVVVAVGLAAAGPLLRRADAAAARVRRRRRRLRVRGGCDAKDKAAACVGSCVWNFAGDCCYEKGGANCRVSAAFVATQPTLDTSGSSPVGIPLPGSEAQDQSLGEVKEAPIDEQVLTAKPAFVPESGGQGMPKSVGDENTAPLGGAVGSPGPGGIMLSANDPFPGGSMGGMRL